MSRHLPDLHALIAILREAKGDISLPRRGWSLAAIAELLGIPETTLTHEIREACGIHRQPATTRVDHLCQQLSAQNLTPPGGWSSAAISKLAHVCQSSIENRLTHALRCARAAALSRDLHLSDITL